MDPRFILGFGALAEQLGEAIVGEPLENERHNPDNGDGLQATTRGLMVWRKADNWTAFTDGYRTWINGPYGVEGRLNMDRFLWEEPEFTVQKIWAPNPTGGYPWLVKVPKGFILHGSRSGRRHSYEDEFKATIGYAQMGADGMLWHFTVGQGVLAQHCSLDVWGWHARVASRYYIGIEFAQPLSDYDIPNSMIDPVVEAVRQCRQQWPTIPLYFPTHAEVEHFGETGVIDGKSDVFPYGDVRADELRRRILARLKESGDA